MPAILSEIVANKRIEVEQRKTLRDLAQFEQNIVAGNNSFALTLQKSQDIKLICELKPKSPSAGILRAAPDVSKILTAYSKYAAAISVLTDEKYFGGTLQLLKEVSTQSHIPTLCKDFIVDPYQCFEAREAGAQAVLLIVKILNDDELRGLHDVISELGMTPIVEVQTESELMRAEKVSPQVILINNRDLETFDIDFETTRRLAPKVSSTCIAISASGISEKQDIENLLPYCSNFLIGSSLMLADDLEDKLQELVTAKLKASDLTARK